MALQIVGAFSFDLRGPEEANPFNLEDISAWLHNKNPITNHYMVILSILKLVVTKLDRHADKGRNVPKLLLLGGS